MPYGPLNQPAPSPQYPTFSASQLIASAETAAPNTVPNSLAIAFHSSLSVDNQTASTIVATDQTLNTQNISNTSTLIDSSANTADATDTQNQNNNSADSKLASSQLPSRTLPPQVNSSSQNKQQSNSNGGGLQGQSADQLDSNSANGESLGKSEVGADSSNRVKSGGFAGGQSGGIG